MVLKQHIPLSLLILALTLPLQAQTVSVTISPTTATVTLTETRQFTPTVNGTTNKAVTWSVQGVSGGNATFGTVSATGLYTAPALLPAGNSVKVRATSVANTTKFAEATVSLRHPQPVISSFLPLEFNPGNYTLSVMGTKFVNGAVVKLQGVAQATTFKSATELTAPVALPNAQQYCVIVENPAPAAAAAAQRCFTVRPAVTVSVSPTTATVRGGATRLITATVRNTSMTQVDWLVNGILGGDANVGTVATDGTYTGPLNISTAGAATVKVRARSKTNPAAFAESTVTLQNPVPVISTVNPTTIPLGNASFSIDGSGFSPGSTVSIAGTPLTASFVSTTRLSVSGITKPAPGGIAGITVSNPAPGPSTSAPKVVNIAPLNPKVSYVAAKRFLEQATWGASPAEIYRLMEMGFDAWLTEQRNAPMSTYTMPTPNGNIPVYDMQAEFLNNAMKGQDQLRQRVAFSLHKIMVVSALEIEETKALVPYHRILLKNALGNYLSLMKDITLDVAMGEYLDMVDNDKANPSKGTEPNENYAREAMQLFSLGTQILRADGALLRDPQGNPYYTYRQEDVLALSRAFTGWTYPPGQGTASNNHNKRNFGEPMVPVLSNHDMDAKTILGATIAAGQTPMQDVDSALRILFEHPNIATFVALRLIQSHVTSNPSGLYIMNVVRAFQNNGQGVRGDLFAVMRAVLLDPEARVGDDPAAPNPYKNFSGHLREPVLYVLHMLKALDGTIIQDNPVEGDIANMGQKVFYPASVFSYFSPLSRAPGSPTLYGPEFQGFTPVNALERVNYMDYLLKMDQNAEAKPVIAPYVALAGDVEALLAAIDKHLLGGTMPDVLKQGIRDSVATTTDPVRKARLALYLALTSSHYQIQN
jgi:uncharacterized protein (DUF1800 family)